MVAHAAEEETEAAGLVDACSAHGRDTRRLLFRRCYWSIGGGGASASRGCGGSDAREVAEHGGVGTWFGLTWVWTGLLGAV